MRIAIEHRPTRWPAVALGLVTAVGLAGCGKAGDEAWEASGWGVADAGVVACRAANDCARGWTCNALGRCERLDDSAGAGATADAGIEIPSAPEVELVTEPPAVGSRYVYVAWPDDALAARIEASTLAVQLRTLPGPPTALRTVPGQDVAVVLSGTAAAATILRAQPDGSDEQVELPTVRAANALFIAPDGRSAVALFDPQRQTAAPVALDAALNELTLLKLERGQERALRLVVGFRPREVRFTPDGARAFVIAERSVATLRVAELTAPTFVPGIALSADPVGEPAPNEVQITPDGARAIVRLPGRALLRVVELASGALHDLPLAAEPTDVDLTSDGRYAVLVLRETKA